MVAHAVHAGREARVVREVRLLDGREQPFPELDRRGQVDGDPATVRAGECEALRNAPAVRGARHLAGREPAVILLDGEVRHRRHHGHVHAAAPAGALALEQRGEDAAGRIKTGDGVGRGRPDQARCGRVDEHAEEAGERLPDRVVGGTRRVGPVRAVAADRAVDEARVERAHGVDPEAEALRRAGAEVLHVDVRAPQQLPQRLPVRLHLEVEHDALLVAVERLELGAVEALLEVAEAVAAARALDLDHLGAEVAEQHRGVRRRDELAVVDDPVAGQRAFHRRMRAAGPSRRKRITRPAASACRCARWIPSARAPWRPARGDRSGR